MRLKKVLITVKDMDRATRFYHELFGLNVVLDQGDNVVLTEGLVLQSKKVWEGEWIRSVLMRRIL